MTKVVCVLYSGGSAAQEEPRLLGTIENKLGLEQYFKEKNIEFVVTDDKEGPNSVFEKEIVDADILITTPFHPGYATAAVIEKAQKLKLCVTAGVGSDHVDLNAANKKKITVAEVSGSNVVSVAEHVVMLILKAVRNFVPAHEQIMAGDWNVAQVARNAFDLEGKVVGTLGAGRIGYRVLQRLVPFDCAQLTYYDYQDLPKEAAAKIPGVKRVEDLKQFLSEVDVLTINCPLHEQTKGMINKETLGYMKKGAWIINTARGAICNAQDVADAVKSGHINFYGGDVWFPQPAPKDHPWRTLKNPLGGGNGMTAHYSGTTLDAQKRYADGTKEIIDNFLNNKAQNPANLIVENGEYASKAYGQREQSKGAKAQPQ